MFIDSLRVRKGLKYIILLYDCPAGGIAYYSNELNGGSDLQCALCDMQASEKPVSQ